MSTPRDLRDEYAPDEPPSLSELMDEAGLEPAERREVLDARGIR